MFETTQPVAWALVVTLSLAAACVSLFLSLATASLLPLALPFFAAVAATWFVSRHVIAGKNGKAFLIAFPWLTACGLAGAFAILDAACRSISC